MRGFRGEVAAASLKPWGQRRDKDLWICFRGEVAAASLKLNLHFLFLLFCKVSAAKSPRPH